MDMKRRAPGHLAVSPLRGWSGAIVATTSLTAVVFAGGLAFAVAGVGARRGRTVELSSAQSVAAVAGIVTDADSEVAADSGADVAESVGTYEVRTVDVELYDVNRDRLFTVTVYAPTTSGPFPLVVLVHGYAASAATYESLEIELASAGFIVAAPDFPRSSSAVTSSATRDIVAQAGDVSFVLDTLLSPSSVPSVLAGSISSGPVAVIGHSDGGVTAAGVAFNSPAADARIGAAVVMSGGGFGFSGTWFTGASTPALLAIHGTSDEVNGFGASQSLYNQATGAKWLVAVDGGSHTGPFTTDDSVADVGTVTADFLHAYLEGSAVAGERLPADADDGDLTLLAAA